MPNRGHSTRRLRLSLGALVVAYGCVGLIILRNGILGRPVLVRIEQSGMNLGIMGVFKVFPLVKDARDVGNLSLVKIFWGRNCHGNSGKPSGLWQVAKGGRCSQLRGRQPTGREWCGVGRRNDLRARLGDSAL